MKKQAYIVVAGLCAIAAWFIYLSVSASKTQEVDTFVPVITVMDILNASDLQEGVKVAVVNSDNNAIDLWMEQALALAQAAQLPQGDIDYLRSPASRDYLVFAAKRTLFNDAFEKRYLSLAGIEDIKQQYPEAADLFPKADSLIQKRNAIIEQMAIALSPEGVADKVSLNQAKQQWMERAKGVNEI